MIRIALPLIALAATACMEGRPETPAPATGKCTNEGLEPLIGKTKSDATAAQAKRLSGATMLRWITPGMMVTMDYREDRLNLHLGTDGKIGSARCG